MRLQPKIARIILFAHIGERAMGDFIRRDESEGFICKLWRGERMTLIGFDVKDPEPDLVGFSIEAKAPGDADFRPLKNRLAFSYSTSAEHEVDGSRNFDSRQAPFQKFRWVHFPWRPADGVYSYRVSKRHMVRDNTPLKVGTTLTLNLENKSVTYDGLLDIGFTRNFASSQAYNEQFRGNKHIIPSQAEDGLNFKKIDLTSDRGESVYDWLGFEARELLFSFLDEALSDDEVTIDAMAYDLNEPDVVDRLAKFGDRLRAIIDDSGGPGEGHAASDSAESRSAEILTQSGAAVKRTHFHNLQHNKVLITHKHGEPQFVLCGSTNFTFRGLYIQANNLIVFRAAGVTGLFSQMFDKAWDNPKGFQNDNFAKTWHVVHAPGVPTVQLCFSPHLETDLSLNPIRAAIDQASSSIFYSVAFLSQIKSGPTYEAFKRLMDRPIFSYGAVDNDGALEIHKPDGSVGVVDFAYLAKKAPEPFASEWSGGKGRNIHHKFLVTDFSLPTAKVFTGSSNFSPSGEGGNGDQLIMIEDRKIATAYAIEAVRVFDHLQFRNRMRDAFAAPAEAPRTIALKTPTAISGEQAWFERYYRPDTQLFRDRQLFAN
jgi:phosphatidylserine/phosphatidylglycerophosphate/cardiolipin synthase-like enzyme